MLIHNDEKLTIALLRDLLRRTHEHLAHMAGFIRENQQNFKPCHQAYLAEYAKEVGDYLENTSPTILELCI